MCRIMSIFLTRIQLAMAHTQLAIFFNNLINNMLNKIRSDKNSLKVEIRRNEQTP